MWYCANCGEEGEDNFDACWKCCVPRGALAAPPPGLGPAESGPVEPAGEVESASPAGEPTKAPAPQRCPSCSSERLRQGYLPGPGSPRIWFQPEENWFRNYLLQAWACLDCGHVSLFLSGKDVAALNG